MILEVAFWAFTTASSVSGPYITSGTLTLSSACCTTSASDKEPVDWDAMKFSSKHECEVAKEKFYRANKTGKAGECKRHISGWVDVK